MTLSPKARYFVIEAARGLPDLAAREHLLAWISGPRQAEDLPSDIAKTALEALEGFEAWMKARLEENRADEDHEAEIINDIRFVQTLERGLKKKEALQHA
jgi:hypothetical protein